MYISLELPLPGVVVICSLKLLLPLPTLLPPMLLMSVLFCYFCIAVSPSGGVRDGAAVDLLQISLIENATRGDVVCVGTTGICRLLVKLFVLVVCGAAYLPGSLG